MKRVTAFAPATVANLAVGFDILGLSFPVVGDTVTLEKIDEPKIKVKTITGIEGLPTDPSLNTATVGLIQLLIDTHLNFGFEVTIEKGIAIGSGMGGSAASSVASLVAANELLPSPLTKAMLLKYALLGEAAASGVAHADNLAPCLFGGITLVRHTHSFEVTSIPIPKSIFCVVAHPHLKLNTRDSRKVLKKEISLADHVQQSGNLAGFIAGCFQNDLDLIQSSLKDVVIEPQRSALIPGFESVKSSALREGALGCSISGSGPSVFAWARSERDGNKIALSMKEAFQKNGVTGVDTWVSPISPEGARVVSKT